MSILKSFHFKSRIFQSGTFFQVERSIIVTAHMPGPTGSALRYCNSTHAWSNCLSIALLQQHTCLVQLAEHSIIATAHMSGPTGSALHFFKDDIITSCYKSAAKAVVSGGLKSHIPRWWD